MARHSSEEADRLLNYLVSAYMRFDVPSFYFDN